MNFFKPKFWDKNQISFFSVLLFPVTLLIKFLIFLRTSLTKTYESSIPIICVGNIAFIAPLVCLRQQWFVFYAIMLVFEFHEPLIGYIHFRRSRIQWHFAKRSYMNPKYTKFDTSKTRIRIQNYQLGSDLDPIWTQCGS